MTYVLGLNAFHADAAASLVKDGELIAAVEEVIVAQSCDKNFGVYRDRVGIERRELAAVPKIGPVQRHGVAVGTLNAGEHRRVLSHLA